MHWEIKKNVNYPLYCCICIVATVWTRTCNMSEVCLSEHLLVTRHQGVSAIVTVKITDLKRLVSWQAGVGREADDERFTDM